MLRLFCLIFISLQIKSSIQFSTALNKTQNRFPRIVNGYLPQRNYLAKFVISLRYGSAEGIFGSNHICCGSILSKRTIMTAAHCVVNKGNGEVKNKRDIKVVAGNTDRILHSNNEQILEVSKILLHPKYSVKTGFYDIAILHLKKGLMQDDINVDKISIINNVTEPGQNCIAVGWGSVFHNGPLADELVYMNVSTFPLWYCRLLTATVKEHLCVGEMFGPIRYAGKGDSGGPLICDGMLVGVANFIVAGRTFYTAVYYFRDWIEANSKSQSMQDLNYTALLIASLAVMITIMFE